MGVGVRMAAELCGIVHVVVGDASGVDMIVRVRFLLQRAHRRNSSVVAASRDPDDHD
jgi:hypothetical protein